MQGRTSRAPSVQGPLSAFALSSTPRQRFLAPRLVTPTSVTRTPSVVEEWLERLEEPFVPGAFARLYSPTERAGLRQARLQTPRFHETFWQGRFRRHPAKDLSFHAPKVPSIVGLTPSGGNLRVQKHPELPSSRGGWAIVHRLFPACGYLTGASSTPADWIRFDGRTRAGARILVFVAGP